VILVEMENFRELALRTGKKGRGIRPKAIHIYRKIPGI
jgi:hypothetical protein